MYNTFNKALVQKSPLRIRGFPNYCFGVDGLVGDVGFTGVTGFIGDVPVGVVVAAGGGGDTGGVY